MKITLTTLTDTERLGTALASAILTYGSFSLLLQGDLGSGKTTLTRSLVTALPGGPDAEVSSPSFTVCNMYPTTPPVMHIDLYRAGQAPLPDEAAEALDDGRTVIIVEWPEFLEQADCPRDYLHILFDNTGKECEKGRILTLDAHGPHASGALAELADTFRG